MELHFIYFLVCVGCRPLDEDRGVGIDVSVGMLSTILVNLVRLSRRLPFKEGVSICDEGVCVCVSIISVCVCVYDECLCLS